MISDESGRTGGSDEKRSEKIERGEGGPRVLLMTNLVLLTVFATVAIYGLSCIDLATFSAASVTSAALVLMAVTYLVTNQDHGMGHRPILRVNYPRATAGGQ